jgi:membrane associated rhomboid family serine protease
MRQTYGSSSGFSQSSKTTGPGTRWLCGALVVATLGVSLMDQGTGALMGSLIFDRNALLHGELWRACTYGLLATSPIALVISTVVLWLFGGMHESMWGTRKFVRFVLVSMIGAALLAVPLGLILGALLPFSDSPYASGPDGAINALLMAVAVSAPRSQVLFGFVLPVQARTFVWLMVGLDVVSGIMNQVSHLSITLGGLAMGYFLITGMWRPDRLHQRYKRWRGARQRRGLYVVPPPQGGRHLN